MAIDAHQHFWKYDPVRDSWITDEMQVLRQDYMPQDLWPVLQKKGVEGCVLVQSDQSYEHNEFLLKLADENEFVKGVVGWVDLQDENIKDVLSSYTQHKKVKGFRHILQSEPNRALMLKPEFKRGIAALRDFNYTYDILIYPDQLKYAAELAATFPAQIFILDHIAKPNIKELLIDNWQQGIEALAKNQNVYCKISGMITEANWQTWKKEDLIPYIDVVMSAFGVERVMFGSDWPVCLVAGSYEDVIDVVQKYFSTFSVNEQHLFFHENAKKVYNLT